MLSNHQHQKNQDTENIELIAASIQEYNASNPHPIQFIHGGSSAALAFMNKEVTLQAEAGFQQVLVPKALIPTGILRKKYGIYPISGELGLGAFASNGVRKRGVNYASLSGMRADEDGVSVAYAYANMARNPISIESIDKKILKLIGSISPENYLKKIKIIFLKINNIMLLDKDALTKLVYYKSLLQNELNNLKKRITAPNQLNNIETKFNKYLMQIDDLITGRATQSFQTDENFIQAVLTQFPILYCATVPGRPFGNGVTGEMVFDGELSLNEVKLMSTELENIDNLKMILQRLGLQHIQIIGYERDETKEEKNNSSATLCDGILSADTLEDVQAEIKKVYSIEPKLGHYNIRGILANKVNQCVDIYFENGSLDHLQIAKWILKNILSLVNLKIDQYLIEYQSLGEKVSVEPDYFRHGNADETYYRRLEQQIVYLNALAEQSCDRIGGLEEFYNYDIQLPEPWLFDLLQYKSAFSRLSFLQYAYIVLTKDMNNNELNLTDRQQNNLHERIAAVENLYRQIYLNLNATKQDLVQKPHVKNSILFKHVFGQSDQALHTKSAHVPMLFKIADGVKIKPSSSTIDYHAAIMNIKNYIIAHSWKVKGLFSFNDIILSKNNLSIDALKKLPKRVHNQINHILNYEDCIKRNIPTNASETFQAIQTEGLLGLSFLKQHKKDKKDDPKIHPSTLDYYLIFSKTEKEICEYFESPLPSQSQTGKQK